MDGKTIEIRLNAKQEAQYRKNPDKYLSVLRRAIDKDMMEEISEDRLELVKIITRTKARVFNWKDLEKEIFKGGI